MISSFWIEGFLGFRDFQRGDIGRVNLFVGANNSGKTSMLEALYLLASRADPRMLARVLRRRGEVVMNRSRSSDPDLPEVDASHLLFGHKCQPDAKFQLSATNWGARQSLTATIVALSMKERSSMRMKSGESPTLSLRLRSSPQLIASDLPLDEAGVSSAIGIDRRLEERTTQSSVLYSPTQPMHGADLVAMWNYISLTKDEALVIDMVQYFDDRIEFIDLQMPFRYLGMGSNQSGFTIKHLDFNERVPIGSMGDGFWHLLSMAIAITQCRNGFLLVDEIDKGLHVSAMKKQESFSYKRFGSTSDFGSKTAKFNVDGHQRTVKGFIWGGQLMFADAVKLEQFAEMKSHVIKGSRLSVSVNGVTTRFSLNGSSSAIA